MRKVIRQDLEPTVDQIALMECFRQMTNHSIRIGLEFERKYGITPPMRELSRLSYAHLKSYQCYAQYRLCAISRAAGILSSRKKSIKRGFPTRSPFVSKRMIVSCYGFDIQDGHLVIHLVSGASESIALNSHTLDVISNPTVRVCSFTLTEKSLCLCISKEVPTPNLAEVRGAIGIDRNLRNVTVGNEEVVTYYDVSKAAKVAENTRRIIASFKRGDRRVRQGLISKYGNRRRERIERILHLVSRDIVERAKAKRQIIVFEEIKGIRNLYRKGNRQGKSYRAQMNSWPFYEVKRQIEYKAAWEGVPTITLSRRETRGTTMDCPQCGERLQVPVRGDRGRYRQLWCAYCERWRDRDLIAVLNISRRGWLRSDHSSKEGGARGAMRGNPEHAGEPVILRVDASKPRDVFTRGRTLC
ncbi:MAG: transposase [Thaumarchaeota archaeon]|nr:transposase [Nitrososphaerota archaeon]